MKKCLLAVSVLSLLMGSVAMANLSQAPASTAPAAASSAQKQKASSILFTQLAESATITPAAGKNQYTLTLSNVSGSTTWFADRPDRASGVVTTEDFVQHWGQGGTNSFAKDAPNANIVIFKTGADGVKQSSEHIVELRNPVYTAKTHELSYQITLLPSRKLSTSKFPVAGHTEEVALFIDSWWSWGSIFNGW